MCILSMHWLIGSWDMSLTKLPFNLFGLKVSKDASIWVFCWAIRKCLKNLILWYVCSNASKICESMHWCFSLVHLLSNYIKKSVFKNKMHINMILWSNKENYWYSIIDLAENHFVRKNAEMYLQCMVEKL